MAPSGLLVLLACLGTLHVVIASKCPCVNASLCAPITKAVTQEVFIFRDLDAQDWRQYDWSVITTVAVASAQNNELMCYAHSKGARIVMLVGFNVAQLGNASARAGWVTSTVDRMQAGFYDGVNVDIEGPIASGSPDVMHLSDMIAALRAALTAAGHKSAQLTFDVAWSSECIDGRCYDFKALAQHTDFLFVMDYDMESQIRPPRRCEAYANSPLNWLPKSISSFTDLGIPADQLVLGVPWYGYNYPCLPGTSPTSVTCSIKKVPFRGVNCSDAAGTEIGFGTVMQLLAHNASTPRRWNSVSQTPFFNYVDSTTGITHQVQYDDVESLTLKYEFAKKMKLRGVGMWNADEVDYSSAGARDTTAMWNALKAFLE